MARIKQDKGFAWVILLICFTINLIAASVFMSPAIYIVAWDNYFDVTKAQLGTAGSLINGVCIIVGIFIGPIVTRCGCRVPIFLGTAVCTVGLLGTILAPNIQWIYFSFGIVSGVGLGFLGIPPMVGIQYYFKKKRTFALGTSLAGHTVGALCWLPILQYLVDMFGWRGAMLLHTGLLLQIFVLASFFRPVNVEQLEISDKKDSLTEERESKTYDKCQAKSSCLENASGKSHLLEAELSLQVEDKNHIETEQTNKPNEYALDLQTERRKSHKEVRKSQDGDKENISGTKHHRCSVIRKFMNIWKFSLLTNKAFVIYICNVIVGELSIGLVRQFTPIRAIQSGVPKDDVAFILSVLYVAQLTTRILGSILGNLSWVNRSVMTGCAVVGQAVSCILSTLGYDFLSCAFFAALYGFFTGCYFSLELTIMTDILGLADVAHGFSLLCLFNSTGIFGALPIAGFIIDITGNFNMPFYIYGALAFIPGLIYIFLHSLFDPPKNETTNLVLEVEKNESKEM